MARRFYRCKDCLGVFAADYDNPRNLPRYEDYECACGGRFESMGDVRWDRLVKSHEETACDERCTGARGPICNCHCGGKNHGTHRTITVVRDLGPVPQIRIDDDKDQEKRGREFRELFSKAQAAWKAKYGAITERRNRGWIPRPDWDFYTEGYRASGDLRKAREMKIYSLRAKKIKKMIEKFGAIPKDESIFHTYPIARQSLKTKKSVGHGLRTDG